ncbi:hypothetical protein G5B88_01095 [Herbaspirillum seropedicae]|uniref:Uncharacterized protein n=1 Tax=Herbaspirillum seropedicae (strain SmR1) TaxID=757424 RepID=D8IV28_HERSS|nr:hypothetical protein [Herbaspirillum seropedicae]ADJ61747.1 hypothetical protein Hsero_0221 [Herbaspirillum seropedicae SmR1]AKN63947.1 hypothetical protein ACP92_01090 [Herbaspirillum seropedicae]NQE29319.1 hypothetical protein [Herbaspirillum seropedicae]UMU19859.1 hypothetical protein G5B88_01095 [Herbaspirillum seropedicae]
MSTPYRYTGPHSAVTLRLPDAAGALHDHELMLWHDQTVDLPADHELTRTLLDQGLLHPLASA